jgi:hypothetical protein
MYIYKITIAVLRFLNSRLLDAADRRAADAINYESKAIDVERETLLKVERLEQQMRDKVELLALREEHAELEAERARELAVRIGNLVG